MEACRICYEAVCRLAFGGAEYGRVNVGEPVPESRGIDGISRADRHRTEIFEILRKKSNEKGRIPESNHDN